MSDFPTLEITLPLPPSVNEGYFEQYYRGRDKQMHRHRVPTPKLQTFKRDAAIKLAEQRVPHGIYSGVTEAGLAMGYTALIYVPSRASDADNRVKFWKDVLAVWLGMNDNKFEEEHVYRRLSRRNPRVEVKLYTVPQAQPEDQPKPKKKKSM